MKNQNLPFEELSIELTHHCFFNCIFCSSLANNNPIIKEIIQFNQVKKVILECKNKFFIKRVSLSGGEPFLHPEIYEILEFILQNNLEIYMYTTGLIEKEKEIIPWSDELISFLINIQNKYSKKITFFFDIQAPFKEQYEEITRISGSFDLLTQTLNKIKKYNFEIHAHFVPFQMNWKYLEDTIKFCLDNNLKSIKILRFVNQGRASNFFNLDLNNNQFILLQHLLNNLQRKYPNKLDLGHPIDFLFLIDKKKEIKPCRGGIDAPIILPNGNVYPCPAWKNIQSLSAGNIYNSDFSEIWNSVFFNEFRNFINYGYKNIKGLCQDCNLLESCKGKCVAQRIIAINPIISYPDCMSYGPDPSCFKNKKDDL